MPLARISVPRHRSSADRTAISAGIHAALQEAFNVPADDLFHLVSEHEPGSGLIRSAGYLGIEHTDDLTIIQITVSDTRTVEQKKQLFRLIAQSRSQAGPAAAGHLHQSRRGQEGELVLRQRRSAVRVRCEMEQVYQDDAPIGFGEIAAVIGEIYLVTLAAMVAVAAMASTADLRVPAFIPIDDPALAANFTA